MKMARAWPLLLLVLALGCRSGMGTVQAGRTTPEELLAGAPLGVTQPPTPAIPTPSEVLALTPDMLAFLNANVDRGGSDYLKVRQLARALIAADALGVKYDEHTRTAAETFRARRGNCLSFSALFVAMAREVGLKVEFQEVEVPPEWTFDKDTFVLNRHIDVRVSLDPVGTLVVDFNTADFRTSYDMRVISDTRALAQYYNNIGVEHMQDGDTAAALASFREAISRLDRTLSPAWTNLGTLYLRNGHLPYAEAAYKQALRISPDNLVAMSNLARVYEREGNEKLAARYRRRVARHRRHNPYYRYQLARQAFAAGDYDTAIGHLKYAVRKKRNDDRFYSLLGKCYQEEGDERAAERWLARAKEVAASQTQQRALPLDSKAPPTQR
jgi:Flp pilus assembly protein TadD